MKKLIILILMTTLTNLATAQTKTTSTTKSSESYYYASSFDAKQKETIIDYLKKEIGENYKTSKEKLVWTKISNFETKEDKVDIKLGNDKIDVNYQNKNNLLNPLLVKKLKKISSFIESINK